jgi:hypothetical protein
MPRSSVLQLEPGDDYPITADIQGTKIILGQIVYCAMWEGMIKLGIGIHRDTSEPWMQYCGPFWYTVPRWFDMVSPEDYFYPVGLQACVSLCELDPRLPIRGTMRARKNRKDVSLSFRMDDLYSFQIEWDAQHCERQPDSPFNILLDEQGVPPRGVGAAYD